MPHILHRGGGFYMAAAVALGFVLAAGASLVHRPSAVTAAAAAIPPDHVVIRLRDSRDDAPALRHALAALRADPANPGLALAAARQVLDEGRARGDSRIVSAALGILRPFLDTAPAAMLRVAADARQYQHDFAGALALLDRAAKLDPRDVNVLLMRATIHTVRGNYAPARADCGRIRALGLPAVAFLCTATTHVLTPEGPAWSARLDAALGALDRSLHPWALGLMAEIARHHGDAAGAVALLQRVLELDPAAEREKLMLADIFLAQGDAGRVIPLLSASPPADGVLLRRAMALRSMGDPQALALTRMLDQRFRTNIDLGLRAHAREEAMFFLHLARDPVIALDRARVNWTLQHEAEDIALLLAAAAAAGQPESARPARDWMADAGVVPPVGMFVPASRETPPPRRP